MHLKRYAALVATTYNLLIATTIGMPTFSPVQRSDSRYALQRRHWMRTGKSRALVQGEPIVDRKQDSTLAQNAEEHKYFHEPGDDDILGHYDLRFFKGVVTRQERSDTLHHMIRAYLTFFRDHGLETWIAHGTLLGWWWNGKMLPWDWDIDTQVSGKTLDYMAKNLNQTKVPYQSGSMRRWYLLDINPWVWERSRGDGMNIIDARWIDVRNGLFIDITGLTETEPEVAPGVLSCKNYHHYRTKDLYPMRESTFEGILAKIPYAYNDILIDEYQPKALMLTDYEGYYWDREKKEWIKKPEKTDNKRKMLRGDNRHLFS